MNLYNTFIRLNLYSTWRECFNIVSLNRISTYARDPLWYISCNASDAFSAWCIRSIFQCLSLRWSPLSGTQYRGRSRLVTPVPREMELLQRVTEGDRYNPMRVRCCCDSNTLLALAYTHLVLSLFSSLSFFPVLAYQLIFLECDRCGRPIYVVIHKCTRARVLTLKTDISRARRIQVQRENSKPIPSGISGAVKISGESSRTDLHRRRERAIVQACTLRISRSGHVCNATMPRVVYNEVHRRC